MAIDKNSKAYQNLLNSGYSDQQITDMYNQASSGQSRQEVVANTKPVNTPTTQPTTPVEQPTQQPTQTTPEVKQETEMKQQETAGSTVPEIQQQGELKPLSQEYYNQTSQEAQDKIVKNLNDYKLSNPEYFTDYESFKRNFSYDARDDIQKNTLDEWYKGYQQGLEFSTTPVNDLYNQYNSGQLSATQLQSLRVTDPTKYAELQNQINKGNIIAAYDDDKGDATNMSFQDMAYQMMQKTFMQFMNGGSDSGATQFFAEYKDRMNSPEMVKLSDESAELQEQIENVQSDIANMKKAVEKEYEGTGATRSKINAIISDRTYELQTQLQTLDSQYKRVATQYNNRMQQYSNDFELQLQEYQLGLQERNQKMDELGFAMDLMNFETNEQKAQREWDYWVKQQEYTNGNINSKDYDTRYKAALKSVQNLLSQYEGIPMQRSAEQMAQDILTAIDNGSDLGTELTKINKQIQEKPEYKYLYNNTFKPAGSQGFGKMVSIGGQDYVEYDGKLYTADDFNKKYGGAKSKANYNVVSEDVLKTYSDGRAGTFGSFINQTKYNDGNYVGQCGKFVNDYLESIGAGRLFGNEDIKTREDWLNSDSGKVGTVAVFDYNHNSSDGINHGHVGIVVSAPDKNGDFWVKDANFGSDGKIQTRKVNLKDASLKGFIDPSRDQNGGKVSAGTDTTTLTSNSNGTITNTTTDTTNTTITDSDIISFNDKTLNRKLSDEDRQRIAEARNKVYSDPNASIEDILRFSQGGDSVTDATVQSFDKYGQALTSLGQLTDLLEDTSTGPIIGALRSKNPYDKKAREIETAIAGLLPTLARGVYGEVGVLTDKDIEHYSKTVPNLKSTSDVNEAVLAMSLDMLASGYKRKLQNQAALGKDVSGMAGVYYQIVNESNRIKRKIGIDTGTSNTESTPQTTKTGVGKKRPFGSNQKAQADQQFNKITNSASSSNTVTLSNGQSFNRDS